MSTLIRNIGILDARKVQLDQIKEISKVENVGFLIVSPENKAEFLKISMLNVGSTLELEGEYKLQTGQVRISKEMLEGSTDKLNLCIAGQLNIDQDISPELFSEKIEGLYMVGQAAVPEHLYGVFMNKAKQVTGQVAILKSTGKQMIGKLQITNEYLAGLEDATDLSVVGSVQMTDPLDESLFLDKIASLSVTGVVNCLNTQEPLLHKVLQASEVTKLKIVRSEYHYLPSGTKLDPFNFLSIAKPVISCSGQLILDEEIDAELLNSNATSFDASYIYFPKPLIKDMLKRLSPSTKGVPYEAGKLELITGEQNLTQIRLEAMQDKACWLVLGELTIDPKLNLDTLNAKLGNLDNFGEINCSADIASILQSKLRYNKGSIETASDAKDEEDVKYDSIIENAGNYTL